MNLINLNLHLIKRKSRPEARWLVESLGLLGGSYVGGNSYPFSFLEQYLSSRPQQLSLTEPLDESVIGADYMTFAQKEQVGLRAMFGWYLHAKLCGPTAGPCAKIKELIDTEFIGGNNIEKVLGIPFAKALENYGLSLVLELVENDKFARRYWDVPDDALPLKYVEFPRMHSVNDLASNPILQRFEVNNGGCSAAEEQANRCTRTIAEPAFAGPIVSRDMLIVQPIFPDNDMDLRLEKNSVTYIQLAGLLDKTTDVTAVLGRKLNVVFVPLGPRSDSKVLAAGTRRSRFIYTEKTSESAHMDVRPVNLTTRDPLDSLVEIPGFTDTSFRHRTKTYYMPREFPVDLNVTRDRELWVLGSIDNFDINVEGSAQPTGDVDTFNIEVEPCPQAPCAGRYEVVVQLYARDFTKEVAPMFIVGPEDLRYYRGLVGLERLSLVSTGAAEAAEEENMYGLLCNADPDPQVGCSNFGIAGTALTDDRHFVQGGAYAVTYDNFLFSAPMGFPYFTNNNIQMVSEGRRVVRDGYRHFFQEEANRQFYNFDYIKDLKANTYNFLPIDASFILGLTNRAAFIANRLTSDQVASLVAVKSYMNRLPGPGDPPADDAGFEAYHVACVSLLPNATTLCDRPFTGGTRGDSLLNNALSSYVSTPQKYFVCSDCTDASYVTTAQVGGNTSAWPLVFVRISNTFSASQTFVSYYSPMISDSSNPVCHGAPSDRPEFGVPCLLDTGNTASTIRAGDIRAQLPVSVSEFDIGSCLSAVPCTTKVTDFKFFGDLLSHFSATKPAGTESAWSSIRQSVTGEQARWRGPSTGISTHAGEVMGKEGRLHFMRFELPPNIPGNPDTNTVLPILVGGRGKSQGKYLLRVRVQEYGSPIPPAGI